VSGLYVICATVLALVVSTAMVAFVLRREDSANVWLKRQGGT
jgi:hypothetical protein